jgi:hypothetical protein
VTGTTGACSKTAVATVTVNALPNVTVTRQQSVAEKQLNRLQVAQPVTVDRWISSNFQSYNTGINDHNNIYVTGTTGTAVKLQ